MAFLIALIISVVVCGIIASGYKFHATVSAGVYTKSESDGIVFTKRKDEFIKTYTTKTPKNK